MNTELLNPLNWGSLMIEGAKNRLDLLVIELFNNVVAASFNICLVAGMIGLILCIFGVKKGKQIAYISPVVYVIIRILSGLLIGA